MVAPSESDGVPEAASAPTAAPSPTRVVPAGAAAVTGAAPAPTYEVRGSVPAVLVASARGREARLRTHGSGRVAAGLVASVIAAGCVWWLIEAFRLQQPCRPPQGYRCIPPHAAFRRGQLVLALVGLVPGAAVVAYYARFAAVGRVWRRRREVAAVFGVVLGAWAVVYVAGAFSLRR